MVRTLCYRRQSRTLARAAGERVERPRPIRGRCPQSRQIRQMVGVAVGFLSAAGDLIDGRAATSVGPHQPQLGEEIEPPVDGGAVDGRKRPLTCSYSAATVTCPPISHRVSRMIGAGVRRWPWARTAAAMSSLWCDIGFVIANGFAVTNRIVINNGGKCQYRGLAWFALCRADK